MISDGEKQVLIAGLQNGIGFTRACSLIDKSPREMSLFIKGSPDLHKTIIESHRRYKQYLLSLASDLANKKNISGWLTQIQKLKAAPDKIYLWEGFCKRKEATPEIIIKAYHIILDEQDTATACGFEYEEFIDYISKNEQLDIYFSNPLLK